MIFSAFLLVMLYLTSLAVWASDKSWTQNSIFGCCTCCGRFCGMTGLVTDYGQCLPYVFYLVWQRAWLVQQEIKLLITGSRVKSRQQLSVFLVLVHHLVALFLVGRWLLLAIILGWRPAFGIIFIFGPVWYITVVLLCQ